VQQRNCTSPLFVSRNFCGFSGRALAGKVIAIVAAVDPKHGIQPADARVGLGELIPSRFASTGQLSHSGAVHDKS
jgi:hypothetical protein